MRLVRGWLKNFHSDLQNVWFALSDVKCGRPDRPLNIHLWRRNLFPFISNVRLLTPSTIKLNSNTAKHRFHIISSHSPGIQEIGDQLDCMDIVILMWGSTIPSIYYGFYYNPKVYWLK